MEKSQNVGIKSAFTPKKISDDSTTYPKRGVPLKARKSLFFLEHSSLRSLTEPLVCQERKFKSLVFFVNLKIKNYILKKGKEVGGGF